VKAIVTTDWLARFKERADVRIVDVRWYLDPSRKGRDAYAAGHIPGAVFMDIDEDLSGPGGGRGRPAGRHPWPSPEQVAHVMGGAGISPKVRVVAYDDQAGAVAARLWFVLRAHGHRSVAVLDGGIVKWLAEGRPVDTEVPAIPPVVFHSKVQPGFVLGKTEMKALVLGQSPSLVLDARAAERYRGEVEPVDPRPGHIPGARSAPFTQNLTGGDAPVLLEPGVLRARYAALGADRLEPIVYCGSGVTACHDLLALEIAGLRGRLYGGSWSEWSADASLPAATGQQMEADTEGET